MTAENQNVTHWIGDTRVLTIPVKDAEGHNVDLTNATAKWWLGKSKTSTGAAVYVKKSSGAGLSINNVSGLFSLIVIIDPEDTAALHPGTFYHEAEVTDQDGNVSTVMIGSFVLMRDMVRGA